MCKYFTSRINIKENTVRRYDRDFPEWGSSSKSFGYLRGEGYGNTKDDNKYNFLREHGRSKKSNWFFVDYPYETWEYTSRRWD